MVSIVVWSPAFNRLFNKTPHKWGLEHEIRWTVNWGSNEKWFLEFLGEPSQWREDREPTLDWRWKTDSQTRPALSNLIPSCTRVCEHLRNLPKRLWTGSSVARTINVCCRIMTTQNLSINSFLLLRWKPPSRWALMAVVSEILPYGIKNFVSFVDFPIIEKISIARIGLELGVAEWTSFLKLGCLRVHVGSWTIKPPTACVWTLINPLACSLLHSDPAFRPPDPFAVFPTRFLVAKDLLSDLISIWPIKCRYIPWISKNEGLIWSDEFEHTFIWVL